MEWSEVVPSACSVKDERNCTVQDVQNNIYKYYIIYYISIKLNTWMNEEVNKCVYIYTINISITCTDTHIRIYIYICVCACVDHLKRCKTSNLLDDVLQWFSILTLPFWLFHLIFQQKQRGMAFSDYLAQRSYVTEGEATGDAQMCTCR